MHSVNTRYQIVHSIRLIYCFFVVFTELFWSLLKILPLGKKNWLKKTVNFVEEIHSKKQPILERPKAWRELCKRDLLQATSQDRSTTTTTIEVTLWSIHTHNSTNNGTLFHKDGFLWLMLSKIVFFLEFCTVESTERLRIFSSDTQFIVVAHVTFAIVKLWDPSVSPTSRKRYVAQMIVRFGETR